MGGLKKAIVILMLATPLSPAQAIELTLDRVFGESSAGQFELVLDVDAVFEFDPDTRSLTSAGTWVGQVDVGALGYFRFAHKFENFGVDSNGVILTRSYECVEGTFGTAILLENICGNYRFGPNHADDGGLVDDESVSRPKSLDDYILSSMTWDGQELVLILSKDTPDQREIFTEYGLTLTFLAMAIAIAPD
jgi:hypothetical protein